MTSGHHQGSPSTAAEPLRAYFSNPPVLDLERLDLAVANDGMDYVSVFLTR